MGAYRYIQESIQNARKERNQTYRTRISSWRKEGTVVGTKRPMNIPRARKCGYKSTKGFVVARVKIEKGMRKRPKPAKGRQARHNYRYTSPASSHQMIAEQKAARIYKNCEVIGSYFIADDGQYTFFEIILADRTLASSKSSATLRKGRAFRGLTSAGQKARKRLKTGKTSDKKKRYARTTKGIVKK
ncbi:MAG: 50S ribosomal protein L15e [Candidatus Micrarchaeia archaeon]